VTPLAQVVLVLLGLAGGFGAAVYWFLAVTTWKVHRLVAFGYANLGVAYLGAGITSAGRLLGLVADVPRGLTYLILIPVYGIPPMLHFLSVLKAQRYLRAGR
jgi:hypothetical protein